MFYSYSEAAKKLNVSATTITRWVQRGILIAGPKQGRSKTVTQQSVAKKLSPSTSISTQISPKKIYSAHNSLEERVDYLEQQLLQCQNLLDKALQDLDVLMKQFGDKQDIVNKVVYRRTLDGFKVNTPPPIGKKISAKKKKNK